MRHQARKPMRERTAEAILRLMGGRREMSSSEGSEVAAIMPQQAFKDEERYMINGVLTLASRSVRSIMTPRGDISWVDALRPVDEVRTQLLDTPHSLFPVCRGELDEIIGVVRAKDLLVALDQGIDVATFAATTPPIIVPDTLDPINLLGVLRRAKGSFVVVTSEFGVVQGLITPLDVLEAIAGEFPDEDETPDIIADGEGWLVKGGTDLHSLQQLLDTQVLVNPEDDHASLAGLLIAQKGQLPLPGEIIELPPVSFQIIEATDYRVDLVRVTRARERHEEDEEE
jgi:CBS domain containing-hemolysin-like protein